MSQENDSPPPPPEWEGVPDWAQKPKRKPKRGADGPPSIWYEIWKQVITEPSEETFASVLEDPEASSNRAFTWIFVAGLISGVLQIGAQSMWNSMFNFGDANIDFTPVCGVMCVPVMAALGVVFIILGVGIQHLIARALGGEGVFDDLIYAYASFSAPLALISAGLGLLPVISCLNVFLGLYGVALNVLAIKAVHHLDTGRSIIVVLWWVPLGCLCAVTFIILIMLAIAAG